MNKPPSFQFYAQDFLTGVMYLTNEEIGIYIKMLCKQWTDEKIPKKRLGLLVGYEWIALSDELKSKFEDNGKYVINKRLEIERDKKIKYLEKQKLNGMLGGRPKKSDTLKNPNETQKKPLEEEDRKGSSKKEKIEYEKIAELFNFKCYKLPKVQKVTDGRKRAIKARAEEYDLKMIGTVFTKVSESDFLNGENDKGWTADFDWIFKPSNFIKILEGKYDNKKQKLKIVSNR